VRAQPAMLITQRSAGSNLPSTTLRQGFSRARLFLVTRILKFLIWLWLMETVSRLFGGSGVLAFHEAEIPGALGKECGVTGEERLSWWAGEDFVFPLSLVTYDKRFSAGQVNVF